MPGCCWLILDCMYWNHDLSLALPSGENEDEYFELLSEAHITGTTDYFSENLIMGPFIQQHVRSPHSYQVRVRFPKDAKFTYNPDDATTDGYYHPGGIADELCSLLSLHFRARFYHVSTTSGGISATEASWRTVNQIHRNTVPKHWDRMVFGDQPRNFSTFTDFLGVIEKVPEEHHLSIMKAASNYNAALRQIGIDPEMVFVKLVSAIEVLSKDFVLSKKDDSLVSLNDTSQWTPQQQTDLAVLIENRKVRRKFIRFIEKYSKGYFKGGRYKAPHLMITRAQLPKILGVIYDARSAYLHAGESMYLSTPFEDFNWHLDGSVGMYVGKRKFEAKQHLPNIEFFEGLVRHCILGYIDELVSED